MEQTSGTHVYGPARVLVIDDSPVTGQVTGAYLRDAGHLVTVETSAATARWTMERGETDVVITDVGRPTLDGFGLIEWTQLLENRPEFIILTAADEQEARAAIRALRLGVRDYIRKPLTGPAEVVGAVERAFRARIAGQRQGRIVAALEAESRVDTLTGVPNRRAFDEQLGIEATRARRHGYPLSLVTVDVDHLAQINATAGRHVGDAVLRRLATRVTRQLRGGEKPYRVRDDEFAILLPHVPLAGAERLAERIVAFCIRMRVGLVPRGQRVTCSAGAASVEGRCARSFQLLAHAEVALHEAKAAGRDRAHGYRTPARPRIGATEQAEVLGGMPLEGQRQC